MESQVNILPSCDYFNLLTPWNKILPEKLTVVQLVKKSLLSSFWNPNIHFRFHKSQLLDLILNQTNPVHTITPYNIHFNIIIPSMHKSTECSSGFLIEILYAFFIPSMCATRPAHLGILHLTTLIIFGEEYKPRCSSIRSFLPPLFTYKYTHQYPTLKHPHCVTILF
jgi:hypothetical protein